MQPAAVDQKIKALRTPFKSKYQDESWPCKNGKYYVGAGGGGRVGRARASPAPEPSLGLASHVNLERLVGSLLQHCERGGVLVIADGGNSAVGFEQGKRARPSP